MRRILVLLLSLTMTLALSACASGADTDAGVATLDDGAPTNDTASETPSEDVEQAMLDYTQCLREQGLDVPDPQFDEDGRVIVGQETGGTGGDGGGDPDNPEPQNFGPEAFERAQEICGDPPEAAMPEFSAEDQSAMQDAALKFAQCMRERGIDMPDPKIGEGGGVMMERGGTARDVNDPDFKAAEAECQEAFADLPAPGAGEDGS